MKVIIVLLNQKSKTQTKAPDRKVNQMVIKVKFKILSLDKPKKNPEIIRCK